MKIDVESRHLSIVRDILRRHLPAAARVWVFGSRAGGAVVKPFSDLDLAVDAGRALTLSELGRISDAFTESLLPWRVDVVDMHSVSDEFRRIINDYKIALAYDA